MSLIGIAQDGFGTIINIEDSSLWQPKNSKKNHRVYIFELCNFEN